MSIWLQGNCKCAQETMMKPENKAIPYILAGYRDDELAIVEFREKRVYSTDVF